MIVIKVHGSDVLIDDSSFDLILNKSWYIARGHVECKVLCDGVYKNLPMSSCIWEHYNGELEHGKMLDHINGFPLDNQLDNLRPATKRENGQNLQVHRDGKYPGVRPYGSGYRAEIKYLGNKVYIGLYDTQKLAYDAYIKATKEIEVGLPPTVHRKERELPKGVYTFAGKYRSQIRHNGECTYLGTFDTPELARAAFLEAKERLSQ